MEEHNQAMMIDELTVEGVSEQGESQLPLSLFVNRELSWLEFNKRVLEEAADPAVPLLERLKFLAIYFSNLDEFFMVRVGSLSDQALIEPDARDNKTGWTAAQQISHIFEKVRSFSVLCQQYYHDILRALRDKGVDIVDFAHLTKVEELILQKRFNEELRPLLSPQVIDPHHPFPFLNNKEQYVAVVLGEKEGKTKDQLQVGIVPTAHLPKYITFNIDRRQKVVFTADLVAYFSGKLFGKQKVQENYLLRITRNADITVDEAYLDHEQDFRGAMQDLLKKRKRLSVVRLQINRKPSDKFLEYLCNRLHVEASQLVEEKIPMDFSFGFSLPSVLPELSKALSFKEQKPFPSIDFSKRNALKYLSSHDLLLAYPFQSIKPFIDMLNEAAEDPSVVSIKISLYRLAGHSKIASALMRAAEMGKEVLCVLELRARFDEQSNIDYARLLEEAGCTVIYGLVDYKIHAKLCLITRVHHGKISYITQIGTGNYNEKTSEQYTDLSYITSDPVVGADAVSIFAALCLGETVEQTQSLWAAPHGFKSNVIRYIEQEIERQQQFGDGYIGIKVNSMNDMDVMAALVRASQTGVPIQMFVRGICCIRPGIAGYTENLHIHSIVGRYLEHSRIFVFGRDPKRQRLFIGSGDLLNRNTVRRVEIFAEVKDSTAREQVLKIMEALEADNVKSWEMQPDGSYRKTGGHGAPVDSQMYLAEYFARPVQVTPERKTMMSRMSEKIWELFSPR